MHLTLEKVNKIPHLREAFYIKQVGIKYKKDKHLLLVLGNFNAKTDSGKYWQI